MKALAFILFNVVVASASAQSSADYRLTTTVLDHAGGTQASADYAQTSTLNVVQGISSDATPSVHRTGYAGQLYEVQSLQLGPAGASMVEHSTLQLTADAMLDDGTTLNLTAPDIAWTISSGPLTSVTPSGLASSPNVYADGTARVLGTFGSFSELLFINVRNIGNDDFGLYAADGILDTWQVTWFGENNANGIATADPDHDGQDNAFESLSGYSPLDAAEFLRTQLLSWDGAEARLQLSRVVPGTVYDFEISTDLTTWTQADKHIATAQTEPFVQTLPATDATLFFRVQLHQ